ncbi:MAG: 16S rRNA (adenine(1518)-N(6)/adenine(1519)-N(6))-dimethyltransferase RsmA [bacterium]
MTPQEVRRALREAGVSPHRRLGQNFLIDNNILDIIVSQVASGSVLEIGAGLGNLTLKLAERCKRVVALEVDEGFVRILRRTIEDFPNVEVIRGDILDFDLREKVSEGMDVVGNLPYYITTPILFRLLESPAPIGRIVVMLQREVAERLIAPPGGRDYSVLSVLAQYRADITIVHSVSRNAFYPRPKVDSAIVRIDRLKEPRVGVRSEELFLRVVRAAFQQRRKKLSNALRALPITRERIIESARLADINLDRRGETLSLTEFARLSDALSRL